MQNCKVKKLVKFCPDVELTANEYHVLGEIAKAEGDTIDKTVADILSMGIDAHLDITFRPERIAQLRDLLRQEDD